MRHTLKRNRWIGLVLGFFVSSVSYGITSEPILLHPDDIRIITRPNVEYDLVLKTILESQRSLHMLTFDLRADETVGWPILKAIGQRAEEGLGEIEIATSWFSSWKTDKAGYMTEFLKHLSSFTNLEILFVGNWDMLKRGWNFSDATHSKLLLIDALAENLTKLGENSLTPFGIVSGRGFGDEYLGWLDTAIVYKGELVQESLKVFKASWETMKKEHPNAQVKRTNDLPSVQASHQTSDQASNPTPNPTPNPTLKNYWDAFPVRTKDLSKTTEEQDELEDLLRWLKTPAHSAEEPTTNVQFLTARVLHHDFFKKMITLCQPSSNSEGIRPCDVSTSSRLGQYDDDILNTIVSKIRAAQHHVKISTFITSFHDELKKALIDALQRGVSVEIMTNSKEAHQSTVPFGYPLGHYLGVDDLADLLRLSETDSFQGQLSVWTIEPKENSPFHHAHRKLAIIDDTVYIGSHNLTKTSTVAQEEIQIEIQGDSFAKQALEIFEQSKEYCKKEPVSFKEMKKEQKHDWFRVNQFISGFFSWIY
jgi:phosphatidylserine/phosphatidylglycerophosphate/cardiolipin synthase-like enzyme